MRATSVVVAFIAASIAPALAYPSSYAAYTKQRSELHARGLEALSARAKADDLMTRSFGSDFVQGFKQGFVGTLETLGPIAASLLKREDLELLARSHNYNTAKSM